MQRVVYNAKYGGFGIDDSVITWIRENEDRLSDEYGTDTVSHLSEMVIEGEYYDDGSGPKTVPCINGHDVDRDNELLADIVSGQTEYDGPINSRHSNLKVAVVPIGVEWVIDEYDGFEKVREKGRVFS